MKCPHCFSREECLCIFNIESSPDSCDMARNSDDD